MQTARQSLEREGELSFDSRGLMSIEGRLKADIRVTTLPDGLDPDEIALEDPDRWAQLIKEAKPVVIHVMETLARREDFDDPKAKQEIAAQVLPLIEDVRGSVEREAYRQRLARLLKVDERALVRRSAGQAPRRRMPYRPTPDTQESASKALGSPHRLLEQDCLTALLSDPTLLNYVDRIFRGHELACVHVEDFSHADHRELFKLVREALDQEAEDPLSYIHARTTAEIFETFIETAAEENYPDWRFQPNDPKLEALLHMFIRLRRVRIDEGLDQLVFLQAQETEEGGELTNDIKKAALGYVQARAKLDHAAQKSTSKVKPKP